MNSSINFSDDWLHLNDPNHDLYLISSKGLHKNTDNNRYYRDLFNQLKVLQNLDSVTSFLKKDEYYDLTLVYNTDSFCLLKSDFIRFYPVFYSLDNGDLKITDRLPLDLNLPLHEDYAIQYIASDHAYNDKTIYEEIYALQSGEMVWFKGDEKKSLNYFSFITDSNPMYKDKSQISELAEKSEAIFRTIFRELIESLPENGRIIVPLSGGHDSRMMVNYLYKLGFKDVICYTYGVPGNEQSKISKEVAAALGYEWHFVEYTDEKWKRLHELGEIDRFIDFAFRGVGNPLLQDFLAVFEMKEKNIISEGDVFVPGHGLDTIVGDDGGAAYYDFKQHKDAVLSILDKFSRNYKSIGCKFEVLYNDVSSMFEGLDLEPRFYNDYFAWQERQAKFVINSLRVYEYFGYEGRVPFCDIRIVRLWLSVGLLFKSKRIPYLEMEKKYFLVDKIKTIPHAGGRYASNNIQIVRSLIPNFVMVWLGRLIKRKSVQGEGLNLIYTSKGSSVREVIGPVKAWPKRLRKYFQKELNRYPFQINHHFLTRLYTFRKVLE